MNSKLSSIIEKNYINRIPRFLREFWEIIRSNLGSVSAFVALYCVVNAVITPVAIRLLLVIALKFSGAAYLGPENMSQVMLSPVTILLAIPALLIIILPPIFEVSGLLHAFSMGKIGKKTSLSGMISAGFHACKRSFSPTSWPIILYFAVLLPLTGVMSFSSGTLSLAIPEFIRDFIGADTLYSELYIVLYFVMLIVLVNYIFMLNFYSLEEKSFIAACRESAKLIKGRRLRTVIWLMATSFVFFVISVGSAAIVSEIIIRIATPFMGSSGVITDSQRVINIMNTIRTVLVGIVAPVVNVSAVTVMFYEYTEEQHNLIKVSPRAFRDTPLTPVQIIASVLVIALFIGLGFAGGRYSFETYDPSYSPALVAHRGDSVRAPENTMPAFRLASMENPDWIELDVHQTADGVIMVSHDDDLTRVARQTLFVHDLTYAETQQLDVGSWFSPEFSYVRLSTLDEVLKYCKDFDLKIQVELKPSGYDVDLEKNVLKVIHDNDMQDRCVILCMQMEPLLRVKELDPDMITMYCMFVAWEHIEDLPVDYFTIEESNVSRAIVKNIHDAGKKVFAWTANTEDTVQYLYDCGVDGILTDDPIMMRNALGHILTDGGLLKELRMGIEQLVRGY